MSDCGSPAIYSVRIDGVVEPSLFGDFTVTHDGGETMISTRLPDQAALHGLLDRIRDLGLCLVSLRRAPLDDDPTS
jgi:hypothetical protein